MQRDRCFRVSGEQGKVQLMVVSGCCVDGWLALERMVVSSRLEEEGNLERVARKETARCKKEIAAVLRLAAGISRGLPRSVCGWCVCAWLGGDTVDYSSIKRNYSGQIHFCHNTVDMIGWTCDIRRRRNHAGRLCQPTQKRTLNSPTFIFCTGMTS